VSQEERAVFREVTFLAILSKKFICTYVLSRAISERASFFFSPVFRTTVGPPSLPSDGNQGLFPHRVKWQEHELTTHLSLVSR
jgi:hypothetical protein